MDPAKGPNTVPEVQVSGSKTVPVSAEAPTFAIESGASAMVDGQDETPVRSSTEPAVGTIAISDLDVERLHHGGSFQRGELVANRFVIRQLLGKGGMGAVYEAHDKEMNSVVALKTILPELARNDQALKRFRREIKAARLVTSRNVCRTFDIGYHPLAEGGTVIFVTMEYLQGETLLDWLRKQPPLTLDQAMPLVRQMVSGLEAIHEKGVIHRDFKSANVMLVEERGGLRAVITDFGLARLNDPGPDSAGMTRGGMGSPDYMAPEQVEGKEPTAATDVYALGVVVYEMLTGNRPYTADNVQQLMFRRISEPPTPPRVHNPAIEPRVEAVILKCLAREQEKRYQTPGEVMDALVSAVETKASDPVVSRPTRRLAAVCGVAAAMGIAVAVWLAQHQHPATVVSKPVEASKKPGPTSAKERRGAAATTEVAVDADRTAHGAVSHPTPQEQIDQARIVPDLVPAAAFAPVRAALARGTGDGEFTFGVSSGSSVKNGQQVTYDAFARTPGVAYLLLFDGDHRVTCLFAADSSPGPVKLPHARAKAPFGKALHAMILASDPVGLTAGSTYSWQQALETLKGASFRSHDELIDVLP
jgi:serine/threonine protein kinase